MVRRRSLSIGLIAIFGLSSFSIVHAQEGGGDYPTQDDVNAIAKQLYCPVCPNTPLDVCGTTACQDWRAQIKDQLADGWTEDQVIDYFVGRYGERVLAEPERSGFTSLVWVLPVVAAAVGLVVMWKVLRAWQAYRRPPPTGIHADDAVDPDVLSRIEAELEKLR